MKSTLRAVGLLAGAATLLVPAANPAFAQSTSVLIQGADRVNDLARTRIRNGIEVLRPTDEEHTNEQATFAFDPVQKDVGIVVMMATGQLDSAAGPNTGDTVQVGNIQGACMPIRITQDATTTTGVTLAPVVSEFKYISQRRSDDNRAYHHPNMQAIGGGRFLITQNWDRNNNTNTERYAQVVDSNCNLIQLTGNVTRRENNTSAVIMAKNNDNCSGRQAGGGSSLFIYADGTAGVLSEELCNGNGRDDGWANYFTVSCAADGSVCDIQKKFDTSVIDREERSRGRCEQMDMDGDGLPDTGVCCGTEGNGQPQREGVWCAGVDLATGDKLYKERIAFKGETAEGKRTYAMRIKMLADVDFDGKPSGKIYMQWQMHRGNNNNNRKGGYDDKVMMAVATPTRDGMNVAPHQDITAAVIDAKVEMTHSTMFLSYAGTPFDYKPVPSFLTGNFNGNSLPANVMSLAAAPGGALTAVPVKTLSGPYDGQMYSKNLGDNPNDQGRNYTQCRTVKNPFVQAGGASQGVPVFNMCAVTGKLTSAGIPSIKPDLFFEIWSTVVPTPQDPGNNDPTDPTDPTDPGNDPDSPSDPANPGTGTGGGNNPSSTVGGCSAAGGSMGGSALFLLGFIALGLRRRRRN